MVEVLYFIFVFSGLICAILNLVFTEFLSRNEVFFDKYSKFYRIIRIMTWVFMVFACIMLLFHKLGGIFA